MSRARLAAAAKRPGAERRLVLATGFAAALPVLVSVVRALSGDWTLEGDQAITATRAYDVLTAQTPLVGVWTTTSIIVGEPTFHPGPLLYWLLAVPARLSPAVSFPLAMGALNSAAVMGVVALVHRRGGRPLMVLTGVAVAVMCASLATEALRDVWNPSAPLLPFTLLIFLCWSLACGEYRLLPLAVLAASFAMQCHLALLLPSAALLAVGVAGLVLARRGSADRRRRRGSVRRWSAAALVVGVLCWSGPLLDQALAWAGSDRGYGNLSTLVDAADQRQEPVGAEGGAYAVVRAIGVPPWWLRAPQPAVSRVFEIFARPALPALLSAAVVLLGLVVSLVVAARRRRGDVAAACALALVLCAALAAVTASFPNTPSTIFPFAYASWWVAPLGMWTWLALAWSAATLLPRPRIPRAAVRAPVAVAVVLVVGTVVSVGQGPDTQRDLYAPIRTIVARLAAELPEPRSVWVEGPNLELGSPVVHALRRRGASVGTDIGEQFGPSYTSPDRAYDHTVSIRSGANAPPGGRLLARVRVGTGRSTFTVWVRPGGP